MITLRISDSRLVRVCDIYAQKRLVGDETEVIGEKYNGESIIIRKCLTRASAIMLIDHIHDHIRRYPLDVMDFGKVENGDNE